MINIYLVGKFNEYTQKLNQILMDKFKVQLCSDKAEMLKGMMRMNLPDIIIINMQDIDGNLIKIFTDLYLNYSKVPVICVGNSQELFSFEQFISLGNFTTFTKELDEDAFINAIYTLTKISNSTSSDERKFGDETGLNLRKRILLIDDNATQLRSIKGMFPEKYEVSMATSAAEALIIIGKKRPDLIFLDYDMPICDGKMTLAMIRNVEETKMTPVVFLTGYGDKAHIQNVMALKPAGYLLKPAKEDQLLTFAKKILKY